MPVWLQAVLAIASLVFGAVTGAVLVWVRFFRTEAPLSDAQVREIEANVKVKEAQAAETVGTVLQNALSTVSNLAEKRRVEIENLEVRVDSLEDKVDVLEDDKRDTTHHYSHRGPHGQWDADRISAEEAAGWTVPPIPDAPS